MVILHDISNFFFNFAQHLTLPLWGNIFIQPIPEKFLTFPIFLLRMSPMKVMFLTSDEKIYRNEDFSINISKKVKIQIGFFFQTKLKGRLCVYTG